jgi:hypothetical protein
LLIFVSFIIIITVDLLFGQIYALLFSILYCNFINTLYKLWRNISNNLTLWFYPTSDEFANENTQHMLLFLDFDVNHILTANRIDDEHSDDEHWFVYGCLNVQTVI